MLATNVNPHKFLTGPVTRMRTIRKAAGACQAHQRAESEYGTRSRSASSTSISAVMAFAVFARAARWQETIMCPLSLVTASITAGMAL